MGEETFEEYIGKYWGPNKIVKAEDALRKTYVGGDVVTLYFENGKSETLPEEVVDNGISDEASDLSSLRDRIVDPIIQKFIGLLLDNEVKIIDVEYILSKASLSMNNSLERAGEILWGKELLDRTLLDINNVLVKPNGAAEPAKTK